VLLPEVIVIIIGHELGLDRTASVSSSLCRGLPIRLRPLGL